MKDDQALLTDMLAAAEDIENFTAHLSLDDYLEVWRTITVSVPETAAQIATLVERP